MGGVRDDPEHCEDAERHFAYAVMFDDLRLCGCGNPEAIIAEVLNVLRACPLYGGDWEPSPELGGMGQELLLHVIDSAGLIEHGASVFGSWITDKGTRFLAAMDGKPGDWLDGAGYSGSCCPQIEGQA